MRKEHDPRGLLMLQDVTFYLNGRRQICSAGLRYSTGFVAHLPEGSYEYYKEAKNETREALTVVLDETD